MRKRFPSLPIFKLWTMPFSSLSHGDVISLLLENHRGNFGLIDHDCYIFDEGIFNQLNPAEDEVLLALFSEESATLKVTFPLTYFLFFHTEILCRFMKQYGIDARLYRDTPPLANAALTSIGLGSGTYMPIVES